MKEFRKRLIATLASIALIVSSCATLPPPGTALTPEQRLQAQRDCVAQYTVMGAVGGAILGNLLGKDTKATLIGAAAGGLLAGAIAWGQCLKYFSDLSSFPVANAQATAQQVGWTPNRGNEVKIQTFSVLPSTVRPGDKLELNGMYYVMGPGDLRDIKVVETRTLQYFNPDEKKWQQLGGPLDQNLTAALGTRRAQGSIVVAPQAPDGQYRITFTVSALGKQDSQTREVTVRKG